MNISKQNKMDVEPKIVDFDQLEKDMLSLDINADELVSESGHQQGQTYWDEKKLDEECDRILNTLNYSFDVRMLDGEPTRVTAV